MPNCKFPLCVRIAGEHGLCIPHRIYKDSGIPDPKPAKVEEPVKPAVKQSTPAKKKAKKNAKRKLTEKDYKKIVVEFALKDKTCHIKSPVCTGRMQGLHHKVKRSPKTMLDRKNLIRSCNACNTYIESHTSWAEDNGFIISKFAKA